MSIKFQWTNTNTGASAQGIRIYRDAASFDSENLPAVYDNLPVDAVEYLDEATALGETWNYMVELWRVDGGVTESLFSSLITVKDYPDTGAGTAEPIDGDLWFGYFGTVTAANLINEATLAAAVGLSAGTVLTATPTWHKFAYRNKILFVPQTGLRHSVSWNQLDALGLVDGTAEVTIGGKVYKVRLLQGCVTAAAIAAASEVVDPIQAHGTEWNDCMYPLFSTAIPSRIEEAWASLAIAALGQYGSWCKDEVDGSNALIRGNTTTLASYQTVAKTTATSAVVWRPCLELVG